jgi:hypothetical protein
MKPIFRWPHLPIILLLAAALVVGYFTVQDYGLSWDEAGIYGYSARVLEAYNYVLHPQDLEVDNSIPILNLYGPAHIMYAALASRFILAVQPLWPPSTAIHFAYFLTFLFGALSLYLLAIRWMSPWAAFGAALLFVTQPLLWGHAFMNPKDTPFLCFFVASIYFGFEMVDDASGSKWARIIVAGSVLGITISIRSLGPMAGALVILYGLFKSPRKVISVLPFYFLITIAVTYLTWPYLWKGPAANYIESLKVMSQFPFDAKVLFWGDLYLPDQLPRSYFPTMFALQLTEPVLFLFAAGLIVLFFSLRQKRLIEPALLSAGWLLLPALAIMFFRNTLYDNARQLLFLLPPLFIVAGIALDFIFSRVTQTRLKSIALALAILPGVFAIAWLRPYEYAYYNSFIGGMDGAVRQFETDYWGISFKEAMEYVNAVAPPQSRILILSGPDETAVYYARPDLQIVTEENDPTPREKYNYVLILTRKNQGEQRCKNSETVYSVGRGEVIFTFVKKLGPEGFCK